MKSKRIPGFLDSGDRESIPIFIVLVALFVCGGITGCFAGKIAALSENEVIHSVAQMFAWNAQQTPSGWDALSAAFGTLAWQFAVVIAGWMQPTGLFLSIFVIMRGFSFSFSVSALLHALGTEGIWLSLAANGITGIVTIPCLLVTASLCFTAAQNAPRGKHGGYFYALSRKRREILFCTVLSMWVNALRLPLAFFVQRWLIA